MNERGRTERKRHWVLLLVVVALGLGWYWHDEEAPSSPHSSSTVVDAEPTEPLPQPVSEPDAAAAAVVVSVAPVDAGPAQAPSPNRPEPNVEDFMRRWRAALAPLFRNARSTKPAEVLHASPRERFEADAGVEPCKPKVQRFAFFPTPRVDLVVVIDTSGSMSRTLPKIARWLAELELEIVKSNADTQLLVVAKQRDLRRTPPTVDGGSFNLRVGSTDALDVLIDNANAGTERWVDSLRTLADLHIVVVTDDAAQGTGPDYVARLTQSLGGLRFTIHLLGGLETPDQGLLDSDQPPAPRTCLGDGNAGLDPGFAYQDAARLTNGLRAPLCYPASRRALLEALLRVRPQSAVCGWLLDARHRVERVDAVGPHRPSTGLVLERANCHGTRRSYRLAGPLLAMCEDTCAALQSEGYDGLEVKLSCGE